MWCTKQKSFLSTCEHLRHMTAPDESMTTDQPKRRIAELGACDIQFLEWGDAADAGPDATPILLLHGWPQNAAMWHPVASALAARGRRVIAPDLRGFGGSEAPGFGYSSRDFARDQVALLSWLGLPRADVIGHDWGGWTAFMLGIRHPERVGRILAISTPHPWCGLNPARLRGGWRLWYAAANATPIGGSHLNRRRDYLDRILGAAVPAAARDAYGENLTQPERAAAVSALYRHYFACLWRVARGHWRDRRIEAPLHLLFGARDQLIPASILDARELVAGAPNATLELLPGAGHFLVDERPDLVIDLATTLFGLPQQPA